MEENSSAVFYVIGSNMLEDSLQQFVDNLVKRVGSEASVKYSNVEEEEGSRVCDLYDIQVNSIPAILLIEADQTFYKGWYGQELPNLDTLVFELGQMSGLGSP